LGWPKYTGANLLSASGASIAIGSFTINSTNRSTIDGSSSFGIPLLTSSLQVPGNPLAGTANATLLHGAGVAVSDTVPYTDADVISEGNQTIYFWVDVPSSTVVATYNATWNITVTTLLP